MLRFSFLRRIGVETDVVFRSVSKDRAFMQLHQAGSMRGVLAPAGTAAAKQQLDDKDAELKRKASAAAATAGDNNNSNSDAASAATAKSDAGVDASDTFSRRLTQEELNRFTSSLGSKENLHNKRVNSDPTLIVDEVTGRTEGQNYPDPTRYGDWEYNGRCYDF